MDKKIPPLASKQLEPLLTPISDIKPHPDNYKIHTPEQIKDLRASLKAFGCTQPIKVNLEGVIVAGHGMYQLYMEDGYTDVPVMFEALDKKLSKAYLVADNETARKAQTDQDQLNSLLQEIGEIPDFDIDAVGFSAEDLDSVLGEGVKNEVVEDEFNPDDVKEVRCKEGDLWQLGKHHLFVGDCTNEDNVIKLMQGNKASLIFTDPPYGMGKEVDGILNDNLYNDKLLEFNKTWIPLSFSVLDDVGSWYCWGTDESLMDIYSEIIKPMIKINEATFRNMITWDKGNGQGQNSEGFRMYPIADEKCLFVMKGVQGFNTNADNYFEAWEPIRLYLLEQRNLCGWDIPTMKTIAGHSYKSRDHWTSKSQWDLPTKDVYLKFQHWAKNHRLDAFKKEYDEIKKEYDEIKKEYYSTRAYFDNTHDNMNNVWHFNRTSEKERELTGGHASPKPLELCARGIKSSSKEYDIVVDFFLGSGSTLIACEQLKRTCYGMELDPHYCDVIISRWEQFTGKTAVKLS